jgi:hypothetical protein
VTEPTPDRCYIGQINPDGTRTLWRADDHGATRIPTYPWAQPDGRIGWGSATDRLQTNAELDCALAILADHHGPAAAFQHVDRFAAEVLARQEPSEGLHLPDHALEPYGPIAVAEFRADATPVRDMLVATIADTGDRLEVAAAGLGLDPDWARAIASGETELLDIDQIKEVCTRLYVTPCDLWPPREARVIEGLWPAGEWPSAQPIDLTAPITASPATPIVAHGEPAATLLDVTR